MNDIRSQFPQLGTTPNGRKIVYLDSAATALKPRSVIERMRLHLESGVANVHRGAHELSDMATDQFEHVREQVARFLNASSSAEIIFTQGTTHGINLVAYSLARRLLKPGDEILLTQMEHHSNIVPWQMVAEEAKAKVRFAPVREDGSLDVMGFSNWLSPKTRIVAVTQLSNALGTWNDLASITRLAKEQGAYVLVDAAQSVSARAIDVQALDCDFLVFSGHKVFGPTGVGVLYGKQSVLKNMPPFFGGGSMIAEVTEEGSTYLEPPHRFEAGTPPIAEVLGLGEALHFLKSLDAQELKTHDQNLLRFAEAELRRLGGIRIFAEHLDRSHILSFAVEGAHPSDVGALLNEQGVAVRAGHHCCQPLMARFGIPGTVRASFSIYSTEEDVRCLVTALEKAKRMLQ